VSEALAAIDVGTNSFHLVVARIVGQERFEVIAREKEMVRLGSGSGDMKQLGADAIERGVAALGRMRQIAAIADAPLRAVATSAVREAENHDEFISRARREAGVEVEVISGIEEARLIHLGVLQALPVFDKRLVLCDIGGGSTELLVGQGGDVLASRSFKLGAVRLTNRFFPGDRLHPSAVSSCRTFVRATIAAFHHETHDLGHDVAIGSSGTIESVARIAHALGGGGELRTYNGAVVTREQLDEVITHLVRAPSVATRARTPGLDQARADIILAGALILEGVVDTFAIDSVTISDYALREGVLLDTMQRLHGGSLHHLRDISRRSVRHLAEQCDDDVAHSERVARFAVELFDATAALHGLDEANREYLEAGALLANVGLVVAHSQHHLHSYYVIRNSERLTGFTDREIEIIAQVARYHRKSGPKASHREFARLGPDEQRVVRTLAALLRVAIGLDRSHEGRVASITVERDKSLLRIGLVAADHVHVDLELYAARERRALLQDVLGLDVVIERAA
jgi:exopolyphosphatase/guanosine-5'-triphosphate,3'-diphosphate pyrophosphatase